VAVQQADWGCFVDVVERWSGRRAARLQLALRMTNEGFAEHLGVSVRTVAAWHRDPEVTPREELQAALDTIFERAPAPARERYLRLEAAPPPGPAAAGLRVAVSVVVDAGRVLLACRRGDDAAGITWQFPAGVVKPGGRPETVAVRETLAETGVHVAPARGLGERLHPVTGVLCSYVQCSFLAGEVANADPDENVAVMWVPVADVSRFIPPDRIYPPVLAILEGQHE
jgi:8-oxo-dGTP diphosphatase